MIAQRRHFALRRWNFGAAALVACALSQAAWGSTDDEAEGYARHAEGEVVFVGREMPQVEVVVETVKAAALSPEQRLGNAELLFRMKDFTRASVILGEIIEQYPGTPAAVDALWFRGETFYASREYLSARRDYHSLVDHGDEPRYRFYLGKALARLVDISLRIGDVQSIEDILARLVRIEGGADDAPLWYAKGKAFYLRKEYAAADQAFARIPDGTVWTHQGKYFRGLVALKQSRADKLDRSFKTAIEAFRYVTELASDTADHRHVIDLAWMAIGRLFYESEQYERASQAYSKLERDSPEFDTMLYELAWVYVRLGDVQRAERSLEVLTVTNPDSSYIADGTLLQGDLLLRSGSFASALKLYESVREQYEPMSARVDSFLQSTNNVSVYYDKLSQQQLDLLDESEQLPPMAIRWAREAEDGPMAFAVIDDVNLCRSIITHSESLISNLNAIVGSSNRVRAFPDLMAGESRALGFINRLSIARLNVAQGLDRVEPRLVQGELATVRAQRRALMAAVSEMPVNNTDFEARLQSGLRQWNTLSQELSRWGLEVDRLQAIDNGLRRMLRDDTRKGVSRSSAVFHRMTAAINASERELKSYRERVAELHRLIDVGRAQVGLGDARYQRDGVIRAQFRDLVDREVQLVKEGQAGPAGRSFGARSVPLTLKIRALEERLASAFEMLEKKVEARADELRGRIDEEMARVTDFSLRLEALDVEGKDLVGHVAERNFGLVRDKLQGIVLRADVGITEQAWEVREEELERVRILQTERAHVEQLMDDELREVLDDTVEDNGAASRSAR